MFARVNTLQGSPDRVDDAIRDVQERILPGVGQAVGFKGLLMLVDRRSGKALGITLWDSEEQMRASEEQASQLRSASADATGAEVVSVERFEVALNEIR